MELRSSLCDASYMGKTAQTALQRFVTKLIDDAPESRDHFDRQIQRQHGDQILYDKRDRNPVQPGPFVLWDDDGYVMKLV